MWFEKLTGFHEESPEQVHDNMSIDGKLLKFHTNGMQYIYGSLEVPSLKDLRKQVKNSNTLKGKLKLSAIRADVRDLHLDSNNSNALFQVASQFNLLEMISPNISPEHGIECYEHDHTQGPICAMLAGAGTIYRNYFVDIDGQIGQSSEKQIDCLFDIGCILGNIDNCLWEMRNGYALLTKQGLCDINHKLESMSESDINTLRETLRIGIQWNTQVTENKSIHKVTQAYCSALPVAYVGHSSKLWKPFASLILEACYEATICAGILNSIKNGNNTIYLTLVGGGVFGNQLEWITGAIERAVKLYSDYELNIVIINYESIPNEVSRLVKLDLMENIRIWTHRV